MDDVGLLRQAGLRETRPRRLVLAALRSARSPADPAAIARRIRRRKASVDLVTVYRTLEKFLAAGIVHRHPSSGGYTLCHLPGVPGHHGFLSCEQCGAVEEFTNPALCAAENAVARRARFRPVRHVSDIVGCCASCS